MYSDSKQRMCSDLELKFRSMANITAHIFRMKLFLVKSNAHTIFDLAYFKYQSKMVKIHTYCK